MTNTESTDFLSKLEQDGRLLKDVWWQLHTQNEHFDFFFFLFFYAKHFLCGSIVRHTAKLWYTHWLLNVIFLWQHNNSHVPEFCNLSAFFYTMIYCTE
jgi:hypothetical protein